MPTLSTGLYSVAHTNIYLNNNNNNNNLGWGAPVGWGALVRPRSATWTTG